MSRHNEAGFSVWFACALVFLGAQSADVSRVSPEVGHTRFTSIRARAIAQSSNGLDSAKQASSYASAATMLDRLPLWFEPDQTGRYVTRSAAGSASVSRTGVDIRSHGSTVRIAFEGATSDGGLTGAAPQRGTVNYLRGRDRLQWRTQVTTYGRVRAPAVYPGIDVEYYGNSRELEYDFVVRPHADPRAIRLAVPASTGVGITSRGELALGNGQIVQRRPTAYQMIGGTRRAVNAEYVHRPDETFGIALGSYDPTAPLIIDPVVVYSARLAGSVTDVVTDMVVDDLGAVYVTGLTASDDLPTPNARQPAHAGGILDGFIFKLAPNGALEFATYIGGSDTDRLEGIGLDSAHGIYVFGLTWSPDFPLTNAVCTPTPIPPPVTIATCSVVLHLSANGAELVYSTIVPPLDGPTTVGSIRRLTVGADGVAYVAMSGQLPSDCRWESLDQIASDGSSRRLETFSYCVVSAAYVLDRIAVGPDGDLYTLGRSVIGDSALSADLHVRRLAPTGTEVYSTAIATGLCGFANANGLNVLNLVVSGDGTAFAAWSPSSPTCVGFDPTLIDVRLSIIAPDGTIVKAGARIATLPYVDGSFGSMPALSVTSRAGLRGVACRNTSSGIDSCVRIEMDSAGTPLGVTMIDPSALPPLTVTMDFGADGALYIGSWTLGDITITKYAHIALTTLNASVPSPSPINHAITWTAVTNGAVPAEYTFLRFDPGTGWVVGQPYGPSNTYTWTPGPGDVGTHSIQVWVREIGSSNVYEDWLEASVTIDGLTPTVTALTPSAPLPVTVGQSATWTASIYGGIAPVRCKFVRLDASGWSVVQDYSSSCTYTWQPTAADLGSHALQVWARNPASTAFFESYLGTVFTVARPSPVSVVLSGPSTARAGDPLVWTAAASGGVPALEYKFIRLDADGWHVVQDYSTSNTYAWTPDAGHVGDHALQVWVRSAGSSAFYEAWAGASVTITAPPPLILTTFFVNPLAGSVGAPITLTAAAAGGVAPAQYKFIRLDADGWHVVQDYSAASTYTWTPGVGDVGDHAMQVWIRSAGSTAFFEAWSSLNFVVH